MDSHDENPEAWKMLSKGPNIPGQKQLPFQTKIGRFSPSTDDVPYAGKTTLELIISENAAMKFWDKSPRINVCRVPCTKSHFESPSIGSQVITSPKRYTKKFTTTRNKDSVEFTDEPQNQPDERRRGVRLPSGPNEKSSEQVKILIQSQYEPYQEGQCKLGGSVGFDATTGGTSRTVELIAPPEKICLNNNRRPKTRSKQSDQLEASFEERHTVNAHLENHSPLYFGTNRNPVPSVFDYPLPTRRSRFYHGCIDRPVNLNTSKTNQHSLEVS